ncbi:MAG: hypothetical protein LBH04_07895 [Tannerellaceae bacterium]|nr:hypothetical protein [Tannerellaceae bacterium]
MNSVFGAGASLDKEISLVVSIIYMYASEIEIPTDGRGRRALGDYFASRRSVAF